MTTDLPTKTIAEIEESVRHLPLDGRDGDQATILLVFHSGRWRFADIERVPRYNVNGEVAELA